MAKKFKELNGVLLTETYAPREGEAKTKQVRFAYDSKNYSYKIEETGDTMYMLDYRNNYELVELIVKVKFLHYNGMVYINACKASDADKVKDYIPYHYSNSETKKYAQYFIKIHSRGSRSHSGLFFTTEKEALEWQKKLRAGECFISLKPNDIVYLAINNKDIIDARVIKTVATKKSDTSEWFEKTQFEIHLDGLGFVFLDGLRFEDKASEILDTAYYTYNLDGLKQNGYEYGSTVKLFMKRADAEKSISDSVKRKQKSATVKYLKSIENHDGKPISFSDKNGKQLHYGDRVAYAVSMGSSAPFISFGIVKGESKTRVSIVDETEKDHDGNLEKHSVLPGSILLIKEAEFNTNSGYSFVKAK
jgi:hypothetical protein